jgi:predicted RNA binding protein YcfA (HicA-like mRNA interferase family)
LRSNVKLPRQVSGKDLLKAFRKLGFEAVRRKGSHVFLRHADGRRLTIPVYDQLPVNLLNWILAEAKISREDFLKILEQEL